MGGGGGPPLIPPRFFFFLKLGTGGGGLPLIRHCFSCYLKLGTAGVGNACITLRFHPWGEGFRSLIKPTEYQHQLQNENKDIHCDALEEARFSD